MTHTRAVTLRGELHIRDYLPQVNWYWWDDQEGTLAFTVGNRHCDPLFSVDLILRGTWLNRLATWWERRQQ